MKFFSNNLLIKNINDFNSTFVDIFNKYNVKKAFLVCGKSYDKLEISQSINDFSNKNSIIIDRFSDYSSNPKFIDVKSGVEKFIIGKYDIIVAIGGGSAIDVAKCIKLFSNQDNLLYYESSSKLQPTDIPLLAIPTTAGTGSETTQFAVMYNDGVKISVDNKDILPNHFILYPDLLKNLPEYQKKSTLLDSMFQAIESYWSINSNEESKEYSIKSLQLLLNNDNYFNYIKIEDEKIYSDIMLASHYSGKAINITRTTAPHAMSYKLSEMFNIPHGIAVAHCFIYIFEYMIKNIDNCVDSRGAKYFNNILNDLIKIFHASDSYNLANVFKNIVYKQLQIDKLKTKNIDDNLNILTKSVNIERLKNNPIKLDKGCIKKIYEKILE